ncbi:MAG TPA: thiamine phosphate synthase [Magnetospirillum sp.]|nr:thiamine phosphate synthase [Magnetospirillum sp.]
MTLANLARWKKGGRMPALTLVTDERRLPDPAAAMAALPPGSAVLFRHYRAADRAQVARRLAGLARQRRLVFLVAGADWRLAQAVGADGVHLPEGVARALVAPGLRLWCRRGKMLTVACHDRRALARAAALAADGALLSPVFPTASHPGAPVLGATRFALWAARAKLPVVALGGVGPGTLRCVRMAAGIAGIGLFGRPQ